MGSFTGLLNNAALLLVLCVIYDMFNIHAIGNRALKEGVTGILAGLIAIAVMLSPWSITPGVFFDSRWVLLSLCGLFFGFTPTLIAVVMAGAFRLYQGGAGGVVGTVVIITTAATGLGWRHWQQRAGASPGWVSLYLFGLLVQLVMLSCMSLMPAPMRLPIIKAVAPPILMLYPFLTMVVGMILKRQEDRRHADKALVREVKERQWAEKEVRKREAQLRALIETMPDLVWLKDPGGVYLMCNKKFESLFGIQEVDLRGKTDHDLMEKAQADIFRKNDRKAIKSGGPIRDEFSLVYASDGHREVVETIKTPVYDDGGSLIGVLGVGRDITARKAAEAELRKSKEEWEKTFNAINDVVCFIDTEYIIRRINRAGCLVWGKSDDQIVGRPCYEAFQGRDAPCPGCPVEIVLSTRAPCTREVVNPRLGKTFLVTTSPVFDDQGRLTHVAQASKDVTEARQLEKTLFHAQKMESIGTLAGGIAHDFNNILFAVMGFAELAKEKAAAGEEIGQDLDQILKSSRRAAELVRHLLAFSRKSHHSLQTFYPHTLVLEALEMLRATIPASIDIQASVDPGCGSILADPANFHQIVVNLSTNALHAMEGQKGVLGIRLFEETLLAQDLVLEPEACPGRFAVLEVSDTGHGMDPETMDQIFTPFFTTKGVGKGTGLGLSVIHGVVRDYKGFVRVESGPGKGSTFRVYLPVQNRNPGKEPGDLEIEPPQGGGEQILVVDDEPAIVRLYQTILERLGYQVTAAQGGQEALDLFSQDPRRFDLVVTDQTMPGLTGAELARKCLGIRPDLPIILCSGLSTKVFGHKAQDLGIRRLLQKPVDRQALVTAVRQVLDSPGGLEMSGAD